MRLGSIIYKLAILSIAILSGGGCTRDLTELLQPKDFGKQVTVTLQLNIPKSTTPIKPKGIAAGMQVAAKSAAQSNGFKIEFDENPQSKPSRSDGTTNLYKLWLFQFNADGTINGVPHKVSDEVTAINDMVLLDVPLTVANNQTIYLVALGRNIDANFGAINSFDALEKMSFEYTQTSGGIVRSKVTSEDDMPFSGYTKGVNVVSVRVGENRGQVEYNSPDGFTGGISIKKLMSQVRLRYKFDVSGYKLHGMRLINANTIIRINNPTKNDDTDKYVTLEGTVSETPDADGFYEATWFMAQNNQGDVETVLTEGDRYYKYDEDNKKYIGDAPKYGTNVEAWAYSTKNPDFYAIYQMYLGKNGTSNFDVSANTNYNIRTEINTDIESAKNDNRIRSYTAAQSVYLHASGYIVESGSVDPKLPNGELYDIDAHYDTRPIVINTKGRIVSIGIYEDAECKKPVDPATSWLRFSSESNYTAAYNNHGDPLRTQIQTDLIQLPTQLKLYLYNEEYVLDDAGNVPEETRKRRLYIHIQTVTEGVDGGEIQRSSVVYYYDQRPPAYLGRAGGKIENGQYDAGLYGEQLNECEQAYAIEYVSGAAKFPPYSGYYVALGEKISSADPLYYGEINNPYHGLLASKQLVTNSLDRVINSNGRTTTFSLEQPKRRSDGYPLLYQYNNYKIFAARYCYDKNRDNNGNGYLDDDEVVWYLPAAYQVNSMFLWYKKPSVPLPISEVIWFQSQGTTTYLNSISYFDFETGVQTGRNPYETVLTRCVRDVKPNTLTNERLHTYTDVRNNTYGAIDAKDIPNSENRADNPNFYVDTQLYTYTTDGTGSVPILVDGNPVYVKRMRRHLFSIKVGTVESSNKNISSHFAIAPNYIDENGADIGNASPTISTAMKWANSMGYLATANTVAPAVDAMAVEKGCPMYRGKDGQDPIGSWRVPTQREMAMIVIYIKSYNDIATSINAMPFIKASTSEGYKYWMSTESSTTQAWAFTPFEPKVTLPTLDIYSKTSVRLVRCIKDLPPTK